ncbi:MAG: UDP-N-acetylglucosamine 1-carboxyvinyltransferase [Corallococcus sp.]|nr:UDP-N-acetylglucosamine 1-carboxyvinyltransferase [Bacillota bacterium]MCM1533784.1 UDP-N-acetylglucosamine 1-carboxyvinyltransferase [Corallococcus sp.]
MDYIINGGNKLRGEIAVYGAKNCALPLLGASILTDEEVVLHNCPRIVDVENMILLLRAMGKKVIWQDNTVCIGGALNTTCAPASIAKLLRGSALIMGSALAKYGRIELPLPGGCAIGCRPIDIHLSGLEAMGAQVKRERGSVVCNGALKGANYAMRFASVGATENLLSASVLAKGETVLENCATEPEVEALGLMLVKMGAKIENVGQMNLRITGVKNLHGAEFDIIPDRIVTATYLSAAVAATGQITVTNCRPRHLYAFLRILRERFDLTEYDDAIGISVVSQPSDYGRLVTAPYPFFPTDIQSLALSLAAMADNGTTVIKETLFENRLQHNANELNKMNADIKVVGDKAIVRGGKLTGATVKACDLRGGAGLVVAALNACGTTTVQDVSHIDRGYINLADSLKSLGAVISCN